MRTRKQELDELDARIAAARVEAEQTTDKRRRASLEQQIGGTDEARRLINARHDRQDATQQRQQDYQQQLAAAQEAEIRRTLRLRWPGDDASFEEAYPELIRQFRIDHALGRAVPEVKPRPMAAF